MCPWPEASVDWPASSPQPPGEQALGPAWFVLNTVFQISAQFQAPPGANSCLLPRTLRRADVRAGGAEPFGTLVQDFSSLCKPHADKTSRVLAAVGREQGARPPGTPMQATMALPTRDEAGYVRSVLPARRQFRKQRASVWVTPATLKSKHLITFYSFRDYFYLTGFLSIHE